jgi:hypothetical protein
MAYSETYTTSDLAPITGDVIGGVGAGFAEFSVVIGLGVAIVAIVAVGAWAMRKWKR